MSILDDTFELPDDSVPKAPKSNLSKILLILLLLVGAGAFAFTKLNLPANEPVAVVQTPAQPSPANTTPAAPPPPPTKKVPTPVNIVINFDSASYEIKPDQMAKLEQLATLLKDNPGTMQVSAYTDDEGSDEIGQKLSEQRADAVMKVFKDLGADTGTIKYNVKAYGELYPIGDNKTEEGRAKNRRVEIYYVPTP